MWGAGGMRMIDGGVDEGVWEMGVGWGGALGPAGAGCSAKKYRLIGECHIHIGLK